MPSGNPYDWLGRGIYFWEHGPARAMQFATDEANRKPSKVSQPGVLGAYIFLGDCFDLLDVRYAAVLETVFPEFVADLESRAEPIPQNARPRADGTKAYARTRSGGH